MKKRNFSAEFKRESRSTGRWPELHRGRCSQRYGCRPFHNDAMGETITWWAVGTPKASPLPRTNWNPWAQEKATTYWNGKWNIKKGNDSNLLIVFYVQIMPDDFVMQLHRFWERQRLPSQPCRVLPQIQVMPLTLLRISLADNVQFSLQAWFIKRPAIRHPYHDLKGRQQARIRRPSVAIVRSPKTCATTVFRSLSYA